MGLPDIGDIFKDLVWNALVKLALTKLAEALPFLGWGPVGVAVAWLASLIGDNIYEALRSTIQIEVIALKNEAHRKAFDDASVKLKLIARDKGIDSPEFKGARDASRAALSAFVHFNA